MRNIRLPVPAGNGVGAAVEVASFMAALKTVQVNLLGTFQRNGGIIHVEVSTDGGVTFGPLVDFQQTDQETMKVCCSHMRVRVTGWKSGLIAEVGVGGEDGQTKFFRIDPQVPPPGQTTPGPSPGGASAPFIGDAEYIKTFVIGGVFHGTLNVFVSDVRDPAINIVRWAPLRSYTIPTTDEDVEFVASYIAVTHIGGLPGDAPVIWVACSVPDSDVATTLELPHNVDLYINSSNVPVGAYGAGDDTNPGTLAYPVQTLSRLQGLAPPLYTGYCRLHFAGVNQGFSPSSAFYFAYPAANGNPWPPGPTCRLTFGRPVGHNSTPVALLAEYSKNSLLGGTGAVTNVLSPTLIAGTGAPFFGFGGTGCTFRFTSGALMGQRFACRRQELGLFAFFDDITGAVIGDTYDIESPEAYIACADFETVVLDGEGGNAISVAGVGFVNIPGNGGRIHFKDLTIYNGGSFYVGALVTSSITFERCRWVSGDRQLLIEADPDLFNPLFHVTNPFAVPPTIPTPILGTLFTIIPAGGGWGFGSTVFGGFFSLAALFFPAQFIVIDSGVMNLTYPTDWDKTELVVGGSGLLMQVSAGDFHLMSGHNGPVAGKLGSTVLMSDVKFGSGVINGITLDNCKGEFARLTSLGPVGGSVLVLLNGTAVTAFVAGMTATGGGGDVLVGINGSTVPTAFPAVSTFFTFATSTIIGG
jgi:hypothetical protein